MKNTLSFLMFLIALSTVATATPATPAMAEPEERPSENLEESFDSLGGNKIFLEKAKALEPEKKISIVQNRQVPLRHRLEIAPEFSGVFGGDTYTRTKSVGLNAIYHFNPTWAVGVKYNYSFNTLTPEGDTLVNQAYEDYIQNPRNPTVAFPKLDYPKTETMALIHWAPFYGKMNLMDRGVAHFDFYFIGGYGQMELYSGPTPSLTAGGGLSFWLHKNFSTRVEMRYQSYTAKYFDEKLNRDVAVASVQLGWLL